MNQVQVYKDELSKQCHNTNNELIFLKKGRILAEKFGISHHFFLQ